MLVTSIFSFSYNVFYPCRTNFRFSVTFILSSASAFNLDQSKNLSFGKELNIAEKITPAFDIAKKMTSVFDRTKNSVGGKKRKCRLQAFCPFFRIHTQESRCLSIGRFVGWSEIFSSSQGVLDITGVG